MEARQFLIIKLQRRNQARNHFHQKIMAFGLLLCSLDSLCKVLEAFAPAPPGVSAFGADTAGLDIPKTACRPLGLIPERPSIRSFGAFQAGPLNK